MGGLARLLTSIQDFDELMELARHGDPKCVNKLVGDIYGDGCVHLGLPESLTAAYFGKLISMTDEALDMIKKPDVIAALLQMVVQESVVLTRAFMQVVEKEFRTTPPVFFAGGFLTEKNDFARKIIAASFRNLKLPPAKFLRHTDFLGALGSLSYQNQDS